MRISLLATVALLGGCGLPPPPSQLPTAAAAIDRMRATLAPCNGVQAGASFEVSRSYAVVFSGSLKGDVLLFAASPAKVRLELWSSFGVNLATLTSDNTRFAFSDMREKRFSVGEASACNIARFTTVPMPPNVLVDMLLGRAPILKHADPGTVEWDGDGYYVVRIPGTRDAVEEIRMAPTPADFGKPWGEQRMRVVGVKVKQYGQTLYTAAFEGHAKAPMAKERVDVDGIDPPIPPSGPLCEAELPRRIRIAVPEKNQELDLRYTKDVTWNPPLPEGIFEQQPQPGLLVTPVRCE